MAADAEIFLEHGKLGRPIALSAGLHIAFAGLLILFGFILPNRRGDVWGGGGAGEAMGVSLVSTIPLPASAVQNEPDAIPIPDKNTKTKSKPVVSASKTKPQPTPPPETESNEVPYGQGGPVSGPYGTFSVSGAKGGFGFQGGGGDFGSTYAWYVRVVQQKVSENWLKYLIDPNIHQANRVYLLFDINRSGQPTNVQVEQSSGVPSLDQSAVRAIQRIDTFGPLPPAYAGNKVTVEFWFDYKK